jgi:hypothetical protein
VAPVVWACALLPSLAAAQSQPNPFETARHVSGAVAVNPSIAVTDVGFDTNVFNEVENPKSDFTSIFRPAADIWLGTGRVRVSARAQVSWNYFQQYSSERYAGTDDRVRLEVRGPRVTPFATYSFLSTRDRISAEVDARVRRNEWSGGGGADISMGGRLTARIAATRFDAEYSEAAGVGTFAAALDRREDAVAGSLRYRLTPLTTLVAEVTAQTNRFDYETARDADTLTVLPGVEFDRLALITGRAFVGYRRFDFLNPALRDYRGLVGSVDLGYVLRGSTQFGFTADRNVEYSFDLVQPYFVSSGLGLRVTQQVTERWSVSGSVARRTLDYQAPLPSAAVPPRTDHVVYVGGTVGARVSARARAEVTASYQKRSSIQIRREYDGVRLGGSLIYEF